MLQALYSLLEHEHNNPDPIVIFSPTAVVHTYCRNHPDCSENEHVQKFVEFLENKSMEFLKKDFKIRANREKVSFSFIDSHIVLKSYLK